MKLSGREANRELSFERKPVVSFNLAIRTAFGYIATRHGGVEKILTPMVVNTGVVSS